MRHERIEHFQAGADAVTQHQRHACALADVHPDLLAEDRDQVVPRSTSSEAAAVMGTTR